MSIPALLCHNEKSGQGFELLSFNKEPFTIPEYHRFGNCRPVMEFEKICQVGEGAYGTVYKAQDKRTNKIVALKKLKVENLNNRLSLHFTREIKIMNILSHCNIMSLLGVAAGKNLHSTYLILEYCPYSLANILDDKDSSLLQEPEIKYIMQQLFCGIFCIHEYFIIHRDINLSNILFTASGVLKIADFGCSRQKHEKMTPNIVSLWYRAPELLFGSKRYSYPIDMWSAGCVLAELLLKKPLFRGHSESEMIKLIVDCLGSPTEETWPGHSMLPLCQMYEIAEQPDYNLEKYLENQPASCVHLIRKLIVYNPKARYIAAECLGHDYLTEDPAACTASHFVATMGLSNP